METLQRVRQQFAALPVLLVTAYTDIRDAVAAMRDGAVNYLAKPIDLDELLATVQQGHGRGQIRRAALSARTKFCRRRSSRAAR